MYDADEEAFHIDASAGHATHFRELRQGPADADLIERAASEDPPIVDPVTLPRMYETNCRRAMPRMMAPVSAVQNGTVPG
jgi:hypothetical protein